MEDYEQVLEYWFGRIETTIVPSPNRNEIWFGNSKEVDKEIADKFGHIFERTIEGKLDHWQQAPRPSLALIIVLDQFSRHIYRDSPQAYSQDDKALQVCLYGLEREWDHALSLIERVFYYFPLIHSEDLEMQATGVRGFELLLDLVLSETRGVYEDFLDYAVKHFKVIKRFGRFPHRNKILGRHSTQEEIEFLESDNEMLDD